MVIEPVPLQAVGMLARIFEGILDAIDLIAEAMNLFYEGRTVGRNNFESFAKDLGKRGTMQRFGFDDAGRRDLPKNRGMFEV